MFKELAKESLQEIYLDYCLSKEEGRRCESFVPFAEKYKSSFGELMSLREAIDIVTKMFLEEVANRYFK